jgi:hypothetical protein
MFCLFCRLSCYWCLTNKEKNNEWSMDIVKLTIHIHVFLSSMKDNKKKKLASAASLQLK